MTILMQGSYRDTACSLFKGSRRGSWLLVTFLRRDQHTMKPPPLYVFSQQCAHRTHSCFLTSFSFLTFMSVPDSEWSWIWSRSFEITVSKTRKSQVDCTLCFRSRHQLLFSPVCLWPKPPLTRNSFLSVLVMCGSSQLNGVKRLMISSRCTEKICETSLPSPVWLQRWVFTETTLQKSLKHFNCLLSWRKTFKYHI